MDDSGLKLMDFPDVALSNVTSHMSITQLWHLSVASPKLECLSQLVHFKITKLNASMTGFEIQHANKPNIEIYTFTPEKLTEPEKAHRNTLTGLSKLLKHPFHKITIETRNIWNTWNWLIENHKTVSELNVTLRKVKEPEKYIKLILDSSRLRNLSVLTFSMKAPKDFKYAGSFSFKHPSIFLDLYHAEWFTVENLLSCEAMILQLNDSVISDKDLNRYIKSWLAREARMNTLRQISVYRKNKMKEYDFRVLFDGIEFETVHIPGPYPRRYRIQRKDGTSVLVYVGFALFHFDVAYPDN